MQPLRVFLSQSLAYLATRSHIIRHDFRTKNKGGGIQMLVLCALSTLLVLLSGCGTLGTGNSSVTAPVAQTQSVRQVQVHLAPATTISTTMRLTQRHLSLFQVQRRPDAASTGCARKCLDGEMHLNPLGRPNTQTGAMTNRERPVSVLLTLSRCRF